MSCFSYMPGLYTLDYWREKFKGQEGHKRFLLTKLIEVISFKCGNRTVAAPVGDTQPLFPLLESGNSLPDDPALFVVVPCYVGEERDRTVLDRLLDALMSQYAMHSVILVDDGSPLPVEPKHGERVLRFAKNKGPAAARNAGVVAALETGADIVAFTDMDCVPGNGWLSALCDHLRANPTAHVVSGNTKSLGNRWLDKYHNMNGTLNGRLYQGYEKLLYGPTCNLALTACVAGKLGFDETFSLAAGEDIEFCFRVNQVGFNIHYVPQAVVAHDYFYKAEKRLDQWKNFIRQFRKYARGEKLLLRTIPEYYEYYAHSESISAGE